MAWNARNRTIRNLQFLTFDTVTGYAKTSKKPGGCKSKVWVVYENDRAYPEYLVRYIVEDEEANEVNATARSDPTVCSGISLPHGSPDASFAQVETNDLSINGKISVHQNDDEKSVDSSDSDGASDDSASIGTTESDTSDDDDGKSDDGSSSDSSDSSDEEEINA